MKATKALKRLRKIEILMSEVAERFSAATPNVREVLDDVKSALARLKDAVSKPASSANIAKKPTPTKAGGVRTQAAPASKTLPVKKAAMKTAKPKMAKKRSPVKKAGNQKSSAKSATAGAGTPGVVKPAAGTAATE